MGIFRRSSVLPEVGGGSVEVIANILIQTPLFRVRLDRSPECHTALIFLLPAGFGAGGAVLLRVIIVPRHILSPIAFAGVQHGAMR